MPIHDGEPMAELADNDDGFEVAHEDVLRGLSIDEVEAEEAKARDEVRDNNGIDSTELNTMEAQPAGVLEPPTKIVGYRIEPAGEPQDRRHKYYAVDLETDRKFYIAFVAHYPRSNPKRKGLATSRGPMVFDRFAEEERLGLWAHFMWPSVTAEGNGNHLVINTYDRARFTWGFYQLAAHTADDNLILLTRELLKLDTAAFFFPDLALDDHGKVARKTSSGLKTLENKVYSRQHHEYQIPDFMAYMNPVSRRVENEEVLNAAKFIDWAQRDPQMLAETVKVSFHIMRKKVRSWAKTYGLVGRRPELAIWISDMHHQGRARGSASKIRRALSKPTFEQQMDSLSRIDSTGSQSARISKVKQRIQTLIDEKRFDGVEFGKGVLSLESDDYKS